jgi:sugar/nucleoside kinase (ribokinase family)
VPVAPETSPLGVFVGLTTLDVIQRADRVPGPNEKITASWQACAAGGPAANAAVVFAALGGRARLLTAVGTGPAARIIREDLEQHGVEIIDVDPDGGTEAAISSVIVNAVTGDRSVVSLDAAGHDVPEPEDLDRLLEGAAVVLMDGHHPRLAAAAGRSAARQQLPVVLDAGRWRPVMDQLLPVARAVICSADFRVPGTADPAASAAAVVGRGVPLVAVTRGSEPVLWWDAEGSGEVPVRPVEVVDTLGAGDFFHGAFCWFLTRPGLAFAERLGAAAEVSGVSCAHLGPRSWLDDLRDLGLAPRPAAPLGEVAR